MIQSVWKNLTGLQKAAEHLFVTLNEPKTHHQEEERRESFKRAIWMMSWVFKLCF